MLNETVSVSEGREDFRRIEIWLRADIKSLPFWQTKGNTGVCLEYE